MTLVDSLHGSKQSGIDGKTTTRKVTTERVPAFLQPYWSPEAFDKKIAALHALKDKKGAAAIFGSGALRLCSFPDGIMPVRKLWQRYL